MALILHSFPGRVLLQEELLIVQVKQELETHMFPAASRIAELTDAMRAEVSCQLSAAAMPTMCELTATSLMFLYPYHTWRAADDPRQYSAPFPMYKVPVTG